MCALNVRAEKRKRVVGDWVKWRMWVLLGEVGSSLSKDDDGFAAGADELGVGDDCVLGEEEGDKDEGTGRASRNTQFLAAC